VAANVEAYGNVNYAYRSSTYGTLDASEYARIPAYSLTNLSAGLAAPGQHALGCVAVGQEPVRQAVLHQYVEYQPGRL
jgi:iron complex outermembrane receptor protein